jgi:hypothetical protein
MWKGMIPVVVFVVLSPPARAQRLPVRIQHGWETVITRLAPVAANSEAGRESPNEHRAVCFAYDQYWLIIPIWTRGIGFVICEDFEYPEQPKRFWIVDDQNTVKIATAFGVPADSLRKPFSYFIPQGWILLAGIALLVQVMSGPGPKKRFSRLWGDSRYRRAAAKVLNMEGHDLPETFDEIVVRGTPPDPALKFDAVVSWLSEQGIGRRKASRNLDFLIRYLIDNQKLVVVAPPGDSKPEHGLEAEKLD